MSRDFIYDEIANGIAGQIKSGILKPGDRLSSVRELCEKHRISMNTAKRVFLELEAQSLIYAKPQSGYFVSQLPYSKLPLPAMSRPSAMASMNEPDELVSAVYANMGNDRLTLFSQGAPAAALLPLARLKKEVMQATLTHNGGTVYEPLQGNLKLRNAIATRALTWGGHLHEDDLITTAGGMSAISFCLMALGKPGDTVAVESPGFPGTLQLIRSLGLKVLELPTHPTTGVQLSALKAAIPRMNICLLVPNFNTPLGSCMPDEQKRAVVALLEEHGIPLIEDDIYGDLYFDTQRPKCCKAYDKTGNVLWCSSVSKTLAPGYRVGWVAPGKYKEKLLQLKLVHTITATTLMQEAVGNFLKTGKYEQHLRQLRRTLQENYHHYVQTIAQYFPEGTKTSRPQGGLAIWVAFDERINTAELYDLAIKHRISIAPGRMFTLQDQYTHCMRLNFGMPWSEEVKSKLKQLGRMAKQLLAFSS
ncbi:MAG: PLP-dependent aminotransferase family protein [Chitinophaga sp.]|uniref:aminotransferase-like domain-containing protein n=1 Tax=Chitinophaga sp. TaxID=1869181 RepID=UPI001B1B0E97|nr:PLP-dependent aminotransferase family protein [Chitinophaga sp.]MBO9728682.1 PLP-dependent aminotransferase family protein [Chitinophaga sp.]